MRGWCEGAVSFVLFYRTTCTSNPELDCPPVSKEGLAQLAPLIYSKNCIMVLESVDNSNEVAINDKQMQLDHSAQFSLVGITQPDIAGNNMPSDVHSDMPVVL